MKRSFSRNQALRSFIPVPLLLGLLALLGLPSNGVAQKQDSFEEAFSYVNNNRMGERLMVSFPEGENDLSKSIEMTLSEEEYFDNVTGHFDRRLIAVVTGMGMGNTGLETSR